jgi:hypothetical protein
VLLILCCCCNFLPPQTVEGRQVDEAVASIFHTVLFHRSLGKFRYKQEGSYSVGTVGYEDVDCDFIDFTYVRICNFFIAFFLGFVMLVYARCCLIVCCKLFGSSHISFLYMFRSSVQSASL